MKIFNDKNIIEIEKEDIKDAKLSSLDIAEQITRKRAFLNILGGRIAMKYLFSQKLDANNLYSLYTIHNILKNIDISDIYCNNIHADVRIVFKEDELFIPKSHEENEICPDVYLIFKLNNSVTNATFLGYIEPKDINKTNENKDYYFVELDELKSPETIKTFLNNFSPEEKEITQEEITQAESFFLTVNDTEISKKNFKVLVHTLLHNYDLREKLVEFENFEFLSKKIATNENLSQDNLLGIVGTQELYQSEEEERTQQEEKAEIVEEVLSDLIETTELENQLPTNNVESDEFLNELISEKETLNEEDVVADNNIINDDADEKPKDNTGELLKDTGIALAGAAGVIAAGAIAANATEGIIGEVAKDTAEGATEALISGVADVAGNIGDAIANNIEKSSEKILSNNDDIESLEIEENIEDTISEIDLNEIEDNILDNIEDVKETVEETTEEIDDFEIENDKNIEFEENIDEVPSFDIEETSIDDSEIDNLDIQETKIDEDVDFELNNKIEEITEETTEEIDNFEINNNEDIEFEKNTNEVPSFDIEENSIDGNDIDIEDIDIEDVLADNNNIDNLDIEDTSIDNLDIQEVEINEDASSELEDTMDIDDFESLFEETTDTNNEDDLDIQEFEIDEDPETDKISDNENFSNNEDDVLDFTEKIDNAEIKNTPEEIPVNEQSEINYGISNGFDNGFDNSLQPLGMFDSSDLNEGLMPLGSLEPIGDFIESNNEEQYEYRPSAPMIDEVYEDSLDNNGENTEDRQSAPMLDSEEEEEEEEENEITEENLMEESSDSLDLDEISSDIEGITDTNDLSADINDLDIINVCEEPNGEEDLNIVEENLMEEPSDSLNLDEISNDIENITDADDVSADINESSNIDDLDIVNVCEEPNSEEDLNIDNISIEEVHNEFDPDSPLADTETEPIFEGITNVEMGFNNNMPDYMKDIEGIDSNQTEVVNLDDLIDDVTTDTNSNTEEQDVQNDFDNFIKEESTKDDADWGDISDILNETENLDTLDLDDNSLMEQMTSGVDNNINTDDVNLDDINTSDALISDIDNFLNNINSPEETTNQQETITTAYSNEKTQETADEQEDSNLKILFKEGRTPEIPNLFPTFTNFVNKVKSDKKMMVAASLACVVATSLLVGTIMPNNNNVVQNNAQEMVGNNQAPNADGQNDVLTEQDAQNLGMDSQYQNESVEQQANLADNTQMDTGQVMSNAFSSEPVNANITKIAWEVSEDLAYNDAFRKYLQMAGKNLKINLQNELLLLNELAYSDSVIINLSLDQTGNLKNTTIQKSSGSKKIDKLVLQCVKDTLTYLKVPTAEIRKSGADATLIINF